MEKSPAFQWFPKDWLSDIKVRTMTSSQRGYYMDLLSYMWLDKCYIPVDSIKGLLIGATSEDIVKIVGCLDLDVSNQFYTQKRLLKEFEKQAERREQAERAAAKRWNKDKSPQKEKREPKISFKEQLEIRAKLFRDTLNDYQHKNPNKYTFEMYKEFFEWWGVPENKQRPRQLVYEKRDSWVLGSRLATWYGNSDKGKKEKEEKPVISKKREPINMNEDG